MSTSISGNVKDLSTAAVTNNCFLRFTLRGLNGNIPRVSGTALIANGPGQGLTYVFDFTPDSSGAFTGTLYSTRDAAGTGNGDIEAGGSLTAVWYGMTLWIGGVSGPEIAIHAKSGVTLDITNVTPLTTNPVSTSPSGDSTYLRLDGGNNPMTGQLAVKNGSVSSPGLTFASSLTTGFWRQAADVIGVSIAGALKWLINSAGLLFGSGGAIGFSSNSDPSAAGGDIFLNRQAVNKAGLGTTASAKDGILLLSKVAAGGTEGSGSTAGDITAARSSTSGAYYLGTDGLGFLFRNGDVLQLASTTKTHTFPANTGTVAELNLAQNFSALQQFSAGISPNGSNALTLPAATDTLVGKATIDTLTNKTLGGSGSTTPNTAFNRLKATQGSALVTGDVGSLTGWGSTATVSAVTGRDGAGSITISSSGTGQAANASFVLTFHDGTWTTAPVPVVTRGDSNAPTAGGAAAAASATVCTFVFLNGTPVAGTSYTFNFVFIGQ